MKTGFLLSFLLIATNLFSQITFERGYFIDNENNKTECLIRNADWAYNPVSFDYKLNETDEVRKADITTVKEFGNTGQNKYIRFHGRIDRSSTDIDKLSEIKAPEWSTEQLFLKVLVEGKASLYYYAESHIDRFFYSVGDSIEQLVFKDYLNSKTNIFSYGTNSQFRQQLFTHVNCGVTEAVCQKLHYNIKELTRYFSNYNKCTGDAAVIFQDPDKRKLFRLKLIGGLDYTSISINSAISDFQDTDFDSEINPTAGVQFEFIFPFNKDKWSVIAESTWHTFKSEGTSNSGNTTINYGSIDLAIGLRHYFFVGSESRFFVNGIWNSPLTYDLNSEIVLPNKYLFDEIRNHNNFAIGGGLSYKKVACEVRYYSSQEIFGHRTLAYWHSSLEKISLLVTFQIIGN